MSHSLSIIIPTLDEAKNIGTTLALLKACAPEAEIIVVDGGSTDDTVKLAQEHAQVIQGTRGRAAQLNLGASKATGEWLVFLHADTALPENFGSAIDRATAEGYSAGVFGLTIAGRHPLLPLLGWGATMRTSLRKIFLGDQAPFIRRALFAELGGFPQQPLMEDFEFACGLKRKNVRVYVSPLRVKTSGRRWDNKGFFRTWLLMRWIYFDYHWRGTAKTPARYYQNER